MSSILYLHSGAGRRRAHGKFQKLPLRPSAITLALFSTFLTLSQNVAAQCATGGNVTITANCTGDITATTLTLEGDATAPLQINGSVSGTPGNFINNTLILKTLGNGMWWYEAANMPAIIGNLSNFGTITVDYRNASDDFYPDHGHYSNDPLDTFFGNIDTSGGTVKLNFLESSGCRIPHDWLYTKRHPLFMARDVLRALLNPRESLSS